MKIFFGANAGKDVQQLDSSYLVWLLESCTMTDHTLREECKKELSYRLNLTFDKQPDVNKLNKEISELKQKIDMMAKFLHIFGVDYWDTDKYYRNVKLLDEDWKDRVENGAIKLPKHFIKSDFYKQYMKRFREENKQYYKKIELTK